MRTSAKLPSFAPQRITITIYNTDGNSRGFNWISNNKVSGSKLEYIKKSNEKSSADVRWENATIVSAKHNDFIANYRAWKANLLDLEYGATYFYRISTLPNLYSDVGEIFIDEGRNGLYFSNVADPQSYSKAEYQRWNRTIAVISKNFPPVFAMLMAGDLTQSYTSAQDNINEWGHALNGPKDYFQNNVITPASGNHDKAKNMFINHFNLAPINNQDTTEGAYYHYVVGEVQIIVLNTNDELSTKAPLAKKQLTWLEEVLKNSKAVWKIVMLHHGLITTGRHMREADIELLRKDLMPLFSRFKVDLVLQGHDHVYTRSKPYFWNNTGFVANNEEPNNELIVNNHQYHLYDEGGTIYVHQNMATARAAALSPLADMGDFPPFFAIAHSPTTNMLLSTQTNAPTFGFFSIKDEVLIYETYLLDRSDNIVLYDYFGIKKKTAKTAVSAKEPLQKRPKSSVVIIEKDNISIEEGDLYVLTPKVSPALNAKEYLSFKSNNPALAFLGPTGVINALKPGKTTIELMTSNGGYKLVNITITKAKAPVMTFSVTLPHALEAGFSLYLVGSFNQWNPNDRKYLLKQIKGKPLEYSISIKDFVAKTEIEYKYLKANGKEYNFEAFGKTPTTNRLTYIPSEKKSVIDTISKWNKKGS